MLATTAAAWRPAADTESVVYTGRSQGRVVLLTSMDISEQLGKRTNVRPSQISHFELRAGYFKYIFKEPMPCTSSIKYFVGATLNQTPRPTVTV